MAFDLGGVLAYQDLSVLNEEELFLFKVYMNRSKVEDKELVRYAEKRILDIYLKIHKLNPDTFNVLEILKVEKIIPSLWTNNIKYLNSWLDSVGLHKYIDNSNVINSYFLNVDKPNKEFYYKALKQLKQSPNDILFFDDDMENVISSKRCGIESKIYDMKDSLEEKVQKEIKKRSL